MSNFATHEQLIEIAKRISKKVPQGIMLGNTPVGHIEWQMYLQRDYLKLDGTPLANASNDYTDLLEFAQDNILITSDTTDKSLFKYDSTNDVLTLPDYIGLVLQGGNTIEEKDAGLPNITGYVAGGAGYAGTNGTGLFREASGAFYLGNPTPNAVGPGGASTPGSGYAHFNAAYADPIYGNSTTVQPPAITLIPQIKYIKGTTVWEELLGNSYSMAERKVGTWVDGKQLWQKTLTGVCSSNVFTIDVSSLNIDKCIDISGLIDVANFSWTGNLGSYFIATSNYGAFFYDNTGNLSGINVNFGSTISITGESYYITIKYTKL